MIFFALMSLFRNNVACYLSMALNVFQTPAKKKDKINVYEPKKSI